MKRPDYIEICIPRGRGTINPAVKRYFRRLENKVLKINFGEQRVKKVFEYKVFQSGLESWISWYPEKKHSAFKIKLRLEKKPDLDKV